PRYSYGAASSTGCVAAVASDTPELSAPHIRPSAAHAKPARALRRDLLPTIGCRIQAPALPSCVLRLACDAIVAPALGRQRAAVNRFQARTPRRLTRAPRAGWRRATARAPRRLAALVARDQLHPLQIGVGQQRAGEREQLLIAGRRVVEVTVGAHQPQQVRHVLGGSRRDREIIERWHRTTMLTQGWRRVSAYPAPPPAPTAATASEGVNGSA